MTFKDLYQNAKKNLQKAVNGEKITFTHRSFYGWKFEVTAKREKKL